jgi:hypothetical protein
MENNSLTGKSPECIYFDLIENEGIFSFKEINDLSHTSNNDGMILSWDFEYRNNDIITITASMEKYSEWEYKYIVLEGRQYQNRLTAFHEKYCK